MYVYIYIYIHSSNNNNNSNNSITIINENTTGEEGGVRMPTLGRAAVGRLLGGPGFKLRALYI